MTLCQRSFFSVAVVAFLLMPVAALASDPQDAGLSHAFGSLVPGSGLGEPVVKGALSKDEIRDVIKQNTKQIRYCYESQLVDSPKLQGKVVVKFLVSPKGQVANTEIVESTAAYPALETCITKRMKTWQFPLPKGGGTVSITYPFVFKHFTSDAGTQLPFDAGTVDAGK